jgi:hypothetical protein
MRSSPGQPDVEVFQRFPSGTPGKMEVVDRTAPPPPAPPTAPNPPRIIVPSSLRVMVDEVFSYTFTIVNGSGTPTFHWTAILPPPLVINPSYGTVIGAIDYVGMYVLTVTVTDSIGLTDTANVPLEVYAEPPRIATLTIPLTPTNGELFDYTIERVPDTGRFPFQWSIYAQPVSISSYLTDPEEFPGELTIDSSGLLQGALTCGLIDTTPSNSEYEFTVQLEDSLGRFARKTYTLMVYAPPKIDYETGGG